MTESVELTSPETQGTSSVTQSRDPEMVEGRVASPTSTAEVENALLDDVASDEETDTVYASVPGCSCNEACQPPDLRAQFDEFEPDFRERLIARMFEELEEEAPEELAATEDHTVPSVITWPEEEHPWAVVIVENFFGGAGIP
ncbi:SubName: Full=Uncharacterized protein {ECO:0000313/EMBL:CCA67027.1} [Serendipita indica DSM 11827]|nr:SubName: Full=Uncharacterized protein {ECO:0000313/EMBL:CCA67027.1} [Serendipita indica DSM 11827]